MHEALQNLADSLRAGGHSLTAARKTVFLALLDKEPQTMATLVKATSSIDRASVYRAISLFEQLGIVQRLQIGWKYQLELSNQFASHHHHITCLRCGQVQSFEESDAIELELRQLAQQASMQLTGHQIELRGICKNCQN